MGSVPKCVIQELGGSTFQNMWCSTSEYVVPAKSMYIDNSIVYLFR